MIEDIDSMTAEDEAAMRRMEHLSPTPLAEGSAEDDEALAAALRGYFSLSKSARRRFLDEVIDV